MNISSTNPGAEPVSVDEVKSFIQIEHDDDDMYIGKLITSARVAFEKATDRKLITQTATIILDADEVDPIEVKIPTAPVITLTTWKYWTSDGVLTALTTGSDFFTVGIDPMRIVADDTVFTSERPVMAWQIIAEVGYGPAAVDVPRDIRLCIMQIAGLYFEKGEMAAWTPEIMRVIEANTTYNLV